jgi:hypothetical protein
LICAASLGARGHAGAAAGGHRQGEGRRGGRHAGQDGQHELAGRVAGVQPLAAHGQDHQTDAALRQVSLDGQQLGRTARQPVRLGDGQHVALVQEGEALAELHPLAALLACSPKMRSAPAAFRPRSCAVSPAAQV